MANKDLRTFIAEASKMGEILHIKEQVSPYFGIPAIAAKLEEVGHYPGLLFSNVQGYDIPVLTNVFASRKRLSLALGCDESNLNAVYREREDRLTKPLIIAGGPVQEITIKGDQINLFDLPIVTHNEKDAGPYITAGAMVVKDPDTGIRNVGIYRHMVHEKNKLGIHMAETSHVKYIFEKYARHGQPMPVAIAIGHHPAFYLGVLSFVPLEVDEYEVAGGLLGEPLELVKCKTVDLEVPAYAEMVLEGYIALDERRLEAPFGEYTSLYGEQCLNPVVTLTAITRRKDPIYLDCLSGHLDHQLLGGTGRLSMIYKTVRIACPTVQEVYMPPSGCCRLICYISIKKRHEGEAKNVIAAAIAADPFIKYVVVVDDDVNIYDDKDVIKAIATRLHPEQDIIIIPGAKGHPLDPTAKNGYIVTKIGIDATKPLTGYPETIKVPGVDQIDLKKILNSLT
ncbi:UbiD family decarboxylase [Moorella sulfitireducens]|uniref:UbiD family decarboxylase n=1 Tax=Neomoorella sulfitireducens TaxID=2972948 RepID=UPI0021AD4BF6|nr:UbiD family decarboxylase [Moorella sulfitireducens]